MIKPKPQSFLPELLLLVFLFAAKESAVLKTQYPIKAYFFLPYDIFLDNNFRTNKTAKQRAIHTIGVIP